MNTIDDEAHVELLLGVHVLGGLDATDQQRVELHLGQCGRCRDEHDRLAFVAALMETVPKAELAELLLPDETRKSAPAPRARSRRFRAAPGFGPTYPEGDSGRGGRGPQRRGWCGRDLPRWSGVHALC